MATLGQHAEQMLVGFTSSARGKKMTNFTVIDDVGQVRLLQRAVQAELRVQFQFALEHPVLVELKIPPAQGWRGNYYNPEGNLGRYTMLDLGGMKTHQILVRPGLEKTRFCAILAHEMTHAYQPLNLEVNRGWNWNRGEAKGNGYACTTPDLARALRRNPHLKVLVASGRYDLGTPYSATDWSLAQLDVPPEVMARVTHRYYDAGHMMYTRGADLRQLKADLSAWIAAPAA